jgi:hypothetical protein
MSQNNQKILDEIIDLVFPDLTQSVEDILEKS